MQKPPADDADKRRKMFLKNLWDIHKKPATINILPMTENDISYKIRGAIFKVYNVLGAGLLESVYVMALAHELRGSGLKVRLEVPVPVIYENEKLELGFRLDMLVNNKVIIEVKSIESLAKVHHKQVMTYLKLTKLKLAILVNFNVADINDGIFRKVNNL